MHSIRLSDQVYNKAQQLATARGHRSVEEYITEVVEEESTADEANYDNLFTPEVMAGIEEGLADIASGRVHTAVEVREFLQEKSKAWQKNQPS